MSFISTAGTVDDISGYLFGYTRDQGAGISGTIIASTNSLRPCELFSVPVTKLSHTLGIGQTNSQRWLNAQAIFGVKITEY
ncbi:MAG: hypothetical protein B5M51_07010 [Anaerolinea sp. 4484_236]|nr:MAG: hypothetical protein B5M51_07010 [Anaerolinea sp. 4484_236]RLD10935.1 MAG: hypothetical protein DRI56_01975 [Chloroflexota bacterium]